MQTTNKIGASYVSLAEITSKIGSGATPKGGEESYKEEGISLIRSLNVHDFIFKYNQLAYIDETQAGKLRNVIVEENDILLNITGASVCRCCMVPAEVLPARVNQHVAIVRLRPEIADPRYVLYTINSQAFKDALLNISMTGATREALTKSDIQRFQIPLPALDAQRKIAAILTAYDDLIEVNKRRIALLEKMAEELYSEWFVRMRFPGHQNTKFVKGVPEGWIVKPISSFCEEIRVGVKKKDLVDDEIYIGLEHIPRKSIAFKEWATADSVDSNKLIFKERDILFSKIRPYLHKVALTHFSGACSSDTIVLRPREHVFEGYLLFTVFNDTFIELATIAAKGTKMPRANWEFLEKLELKIPPTELLERYQSKFDEIFSLITSLLRANQISMETRDLLLPRLISGKLAVEDLDIQFPPSMQEDGMHTEDDDSVKTNKLKEAHA